MVFEGDGLRNISVCESGLWASNLPQDGPVKVCAWKKNQRSHEKPWANE